MLKSQPTVFCSCLNEVDLTHVFPPQGTSQPLMLSKTGSTSAQHGEHFKQQNHQQQNHQKHKNEVPTTLQKRHWYVAWKLKQEGRALPVASELAGTHLPSNSDIVYRHSRVNDHKSTQSMNFDITNKSYQVGESENMESTNNEDRFCVCAYW